MEIGGGDVRVWDFVGDFAERIFGNTVESTTEKNLTRIDGVLGRFFAVHKLCHFEREGAVGVAGSRVLFVLRFEGVDLFVAKESEVLQEFDYVAVVDVDEVLVEAIHAGAFGIEPDGTSFAFTEFTAVGIGD